MQTTPQIDPTDPRSAFHHKRTRAERKATRREYEKAHPVLSGAVRIVDYVPPRWNYTPATSH